MQITANGFIGWAPDRNDELFISTSSGSDSLQRFNDSLKTKPADWYYRDKVITYKRNVNGHRCKNIEEINLNNYFLAIGCSHTEGVGLILEDTYAYSLSNQLNCDYYNLGLGGSGIDVLQYNLLTWMAKIKQKPKFIVFQHPHENRFALVDDYEIKLQGSWTKVKESNEFLILADKLNYFSSKYKLIEVLIENVIDVPIIHLHIPYKYGFEFTETPTSIVVDPNIDKARDDIHFGVETNKKITSDILQKLQSII